MLVTICLPELTLPQSLVHVCCASGSDYFSTLQEGLFQAYKDTLNGTCVEGGMHLSRHWEHTSLPLEFRKVISYGQIVCRSRTGSLESYRARL